MFSLVRNAALALVSSYAPDKGLNVEWANEVLRGDALDTFPQVALRNVQMALTNTIAPVCKMIQETLHEDVEQLVQVLADLEPPFESGDDDDDTSADESVPLERSNILSYSASFPNIRSYPPPTVSRRRCRSFETALSPPDDSPEGLAEPLPSIVVTLCPSEPHESSCLVPYQDAAFGNNLVVPAHPALNYVHPPLVTKSVPLVENWRYENGHWRAVVPTLEEQVTKGMFSRPVSHRRFAKVPCSRNVCQKRSHYRGSQRME